ncbi:hypothetical protein BC936DRAFT_145554 [Jimgerdemannia flammicorona]|uniref:Uncharacterized protein n=1 Tax=Jimgerdemannia flammicorona TaxID=994334 RepID=A0A433D9U3_9FUNG|nr:hypothetical protein BC936DRAFT_145554 [Jimgerdemannia flammicorona]
MSKPSFRTHQIHRHSHDRHGHSQVHSHDRYDPTLIASRPPLPPIDALKNRHVCHQDPHYFLSPHPMPGPSNPVGCQSTIAGNAFLGKEITTKKETLYLAAQGPQVVRERYPHVRVGQATEGVCSWGQG